MKHFNFKWLAVILLMCAPTFAWADDESGTDSNVSLKLSGLTQVENTSYGTLGEYTEDGYGVTLNFTSNCYDTYAADGGLGWQYSEGDYLDLSGYSEIIVNYSSDYAIQLYVVESGDNNGSTAAGEAGANQTIRYVLSEHTTGNGFGWNGSGTIDYSSIQYLLIQTGQNVYSSFAVTITSIELVPKVGSGDEGGDGDETGDEGGETGEDDSYWDEVIAKADYDLSEKDAELPNGGGSFVIIGNGTDSSQTNTIIFPEGETEKYTITLVDVTINTNGREATTEESSEGKQMRTRGYTWEIDPGTEENSGIYIPAGTNVDFYYKGTNVIEGTKYGFYAGEDAKWNIYPIGKYFSDAGAGNVDTETTQITITGGKEKGENGMGICNEGDKLEFYGNYVNNQGSYSQSSGDYLGLITITAELCGIYSPKGVSVQRTNLNITVTGDGLVTEKTVPTTSDEASAYSPGYTIEELVCGIYVKTSTQNTEQLMNLSCVHLVLVAKGSQTYGLFLDGADEGNTSASCFLGYGTFEITATQCVMHHEGLYNGYTQSAVEGKCILILHGPFCEHKTGYWGGNEYVFQDSWYCDGINGEASLGGEDAIYIIVDGDDMDGFYNDYNINYDTKVGEVEYVGRNLYAGWNTLCLPYKYKVHSTDDVDETYYSEDDGYHEARDVIDAYAIYESNSDDIYDTSSGTITFTYLDKDDEDLVLEPNTAYLVWIDDQTDEAKAGKMNYCIKTKFTAMDTDLEVVENHNATNEIFFDPVFDAETMTGDQISGDSDSSHHHYKLTAHNSYTDGSGSIVVDENDEGTYDNDNDYTYVGVANYFNKTASETTFPAYRCYIDVDATSEAEAATKLNIAFGADSETTGIEQLESETLAPEIDGNAKVNVYGINGQLVKVAAGKTAASGLPKGVYVVDGKKVVVM